MPDRTSSQIIICNSGPLIALCGIRKLELLRQIYGKVLIPESVFREVTLSSELPGAREIENCGWIHRIRGNRHPDTFLTNELGMGEAEVIALAINQKAHRVLIDERKARRIAEYYYGLCVTGTGGILLRAKKDGHIGSVRPFMREMRENGYYLSDRLIERIVREAGE